MKVFKFGGASVKDAGAVRNVASILSAFSSEEIVVVISAMGKTTNALEKIVESYLNADGNVQTLTDQLRSFHLNIINDLNFPAQHPVRKELEQSFVEIEWATEEPPSKGFNWAYDQIVCHGELIATKIISHYLNLKGMNNVWLDVRDVLKTDNTYREAVVDWELTKPLINKIGRAHV